MRSEGFFRNRFGQRRVDPHWNVIAPRLRDADLDQPVIIGIGSAFAPNARRVEGVAERRAARVAV